MSRPASGRSGAHPRATPGVRAQAWDKDGSLLDHFAFDLVGQVTLLRNPPSPAATSAMSIADYVLKEYLKIMPQVERS